MPVIINGTTGVTFPNGVTMSDGTSAPVTVAQGGTGANTASAARTSLGVAIGTDVLAPNGSGANLTSLNASSISAGTVGTARLASGTANNTTYLRGDQTWATVQGGPNPLHGDQVFTSSGTFNVPTGVTTVKVTVIGAGGNGGNGSRDNCGGDQRGGGGGAGGVVIDYVAVTSGGTATVTVGTVGGTRASSFAGSTTLTASGGGNGANAPQNNPNIYTIGTSGAASRFGLTAYQTSLVRVTPGFEPRTFWASGNAEDGVVYGGFGFGVAGQFRGNNNGLQAGLGYGSGGGGGFGIGGLNGGGAGTNGLVIVEW